VLDIDDGVVTSKALGVYFDFCFQHARSGFPNGINFDKRDFILPARQNHTCLALLAQCAATDITLHMVDKKKESIILNMANGANTYVETVSKFAR